MPNIIDSNGLQVNSLNEILSSLINSFNNIYGANINLDQNTPDAQLINVLSQILVSYSELLQDINASFDPDQAVGVILDQRVKINGIKRKQGTKTITNVRVTFNGSATLKGQDLYPIEECFQISDNTGNRLVPINTTTGVNGNEIVVPFIAINYGALNFTEGTITNIDTPTSGIASVTNFATTPENIGTDEESDTSLRVRRTAMAEQIGNFGEVKTLQQALYAVSPDIQYIGVEENKGTIVDANGIPPSGIWIIAKGAYDFETFAKTIYKYRISGTPMKHNEDSSSSSGDEITDFSFPVQRGEGQEPFIAYWSKAKEKPIYCRITCFMLNETLNEDMVKSIISDTTTPQTKQTLSISSIIKVLMDSNENLVITSLEISEDNVTWVSFISPNVDEYLRIPYGNITVTEYNQ